MSCDNTTYNKILQGSHYHKLGQWFTGCILNYDQELYQICTVEVCTLMAQYFLIKYLCKFCFICSARDTRGFITCNSFCLKWPSPFVTHVQKLEYSIILYFQSKTALERGDPKQVKVILSKGVTNYKTIKTSLITIKDK